mgnify:FL=1
MVKVLFVCLGNICRSPMAEAVFRDMVKREGLEDKIAVDSAGTGSWHVGDPPHRGTRDVLDRHQISYEGLKARQVNQQDLSNFDYIVAMDAGNLGELRKMAGFKKTGEIRRLMDFVPNSDILDVPDPYYAGNFDEVYEMVAKGCRGLLETIKQKHHLS